MSKLARRQGSAAVLLPLLIFLLVLVAVLFSLGNIAATTAEERLHGAEEALERAVIQCYALEGRYPPDLDYLSHQYGLILDHDRFVYHYESQGDNILPQISVFSLHAGY